LNSGGSTFESRPENRCPRLFSRLFSFPPGKYPYITSTRPRPLASKELSSFGDRPTRLHITEFTTEHNSNTGKQDVKYFELKNCISCKIPPITYSPSYDNNVCGTTVSSYAVKYDRTAAAEPSTSEGYSLHASPQHITKLITLYLNTAPSCIKIEYFNASATTLTVQHMCHLFNNLQVNQKAYTFPDEVTV
jgi:hypothetical protein